MDHTRMQHATLECRCLIRAVSDGAPDPARQLDRFAEACNGSDDRAPVDWPNSDETTNCCLSSAELNVRTDSAPGERCYGVGGEDGNFVAYINRWSAAMPQPNDLSRSLVALDQDSTIIAVVEMSQSSWLVGGVLPGIERQPRKKLEPNPERLLALLHRWRDESVRAGRTITRIAVAFEAGRDGFWLARWLEARGVEAHVIHPSSVAVSREHRRAKNRTNTTPTP